MNLENIKTKGNPFALALKIKTASPQTLRIVCRDAHKPATRYTDRTVEVTGNKIVNEIGETITDEKGALPFTLRMPDTPEEMQISIYNPRYGNVPKGVDNSFAAYDFKVQKLERHPFRLSIRDRAFMHAMSDFAQRAAGGALSIGKFRSDDGRFTFMYHHVIMVKDENWKPTSKESKTPASMGHVSKNFNFSKKYIKDFTVSDTVVIGAHEYGHGFKNEKVNRDPADEVAADICGLYMCLCMGYPSYDCWNVYRKVFYNSNTPENQKRLDILSEFIKKYNRGEITSLR